MSETRPLPGSTTIRAVAGRARAALRLPVVPAHAPPVDPGPDQGWLRRLDRTRAALELAREVVAADGWTSGGWFRVRRPGGGRATGGTRLVSSGEARTLLGPGAEVAGSCLVGMLLRFAADPDRATSVADVWGCVDELYEAVHERAGHTSFPAGRSYPHEERRARLQGLTSWNDASGRTREQVLDLLDRAVSRTIVGACR